MIACATTKRNRRNDLKPELAKQGNCKQNNQTGSTRGAVIAGQVLCRSQRQFDFEYGMDKPILQ
jgi:hypothetical protein